MDTQQAAAAQKKTPFLKDLAKYALIALVIVVPIRLWIAQPFVVNGSSMDSTFKHGEYLVVDEISYRFKDPQRGDILIFRYPNNPSQYFIKRLIGLPGETVVVTNDSVVVKNADHPEGVKLDEKAYTHSPTFGNTTMTLGPTEYFVMGDNRLVSSDSRIWGALPKSDLIGRPVLRLLPLSRTDLFPGEVASSTIINR